MISLICSFFGLFGLLSFVTAAKSTEQKIFRRRILFCCSVATFAILTTMWYNSPNVELSTWGILATASAAPLFASGSAILLIFPKKLSTVRLLLPGAVIFTTLGLILQGAELEFLKRMMTMLARMDVIFTTKEIPTIINIFVFCVLASIAVAPAIHAVENTYRFFKKQVITQPVQ